VAIWRTVAIVAGLVPARRHAPESRRLAPSPLYPPSHGRVPCRSHFGSPEPCMIRPCPPGALTSLPAQPWAGARPVSLRIAGALHDQAVPALSLRRSAGARRPHLCTRPAMGGCPAGLTSDRRSPGAIRSCPLCAFRRSAGAWRLASVPAQLWAGALPVSLRIARALHDRAVLALRPAPECRRRLAPSPLYPPSHGRVPGRSHFGSPEPCMIRPCPLGAMRRRADALRPHLCTRPAMGGCPAGLTSNRPSPCTIRPCPLGAMRPTESH
jgi:hypothetical protein